VLARADGTPTYNFCVVVDDIDLAITHVIRGDDHVNNTPRQINIFRRPPARAPGVRPRADRAGRGRPQALEAARRRQRDAVREDGFLPEAMVNFLARLGWAHGDDEVFTREELIAWFSLEHVSPCAFPLQRRKAPVAQSRAHEAAAGGRAGQRFEPYLLRAGLDPAAGPPPGDVAMLLRDRVQTLTDMATAAHYFYRAPQPCARARRRISSTRQPAPPSWTSPDNCRPWSGRASRSAPP
jgi:glutamyl-tRNA synthetase